MKILFSILSGIVRFNFSLHQTGGTSEYARIVSKTENFSKILRFSANQIKTYNAGNKLRFDGKQNPEIDMNATELIEYNGFNPEVHHVTTEDGFILGQCSNVLI